MNLYNVPHTFTGLTGGRCLFCQVHQHDHDEEPTS